MSWRARVELIVSPLSALLLGCAHPAAPRTSPPTPSAPQSVNGKVAPAGTHPALAAPSASRPLSLECRDSGPGERMPLGGRPGLGWSNTAFLSAQATSASPYQVDGRDRITQRVTRELSGFVPFDPGARLRVWTLTLDPPVKDRERMAYFAPDDGPKTVPIVDLERRSPLALLTWAPHPPPEYRVLHAEFGGGVRLQGDRGSFLVLGDDEYSSVDAATVLDTGDVVVAKRSASRVVLCTATRTACTTRIERSPVTSDCIGIARGPNGDLALLDLTQNGATPELYRDSREAPVALPPLDGLVAASDPRCAAPGEWSVVGRAAVFRQGGVTWPSWLLLHLVGTLWCVDAVDHWRGPLDRTVARFGAEPLAARYEFDDHASAVVRTPGTCNIVN